MESPRPREAFARIPLDLQCAMLVADLPNRCMIVLAEVVARRYGPAAEPAAFLEPAGLEDVTGLHRNNARAALAELLAARVLIRQPDNSYRLNEDYEAWAVAGRRLGDRLGGGLLRFARSMPGRFGRPARAVSRIKGSERDPIQGDCGISDRPNSTRLGSGPEPQSTRIAIDADDQHASQFNEIGVGTETQSTRIATDADHLLLTQSNQIGSGADAIAVNRCSESNSGKIDAEPRAPVCAPTHPSVHAPAPVHAPPRELNSGNSINSIPGINSGGDGNSRAGAGAKGDPAPPGGAPTRLESAYGDGALSGNVIPDEAILAKIHAAIAAWYPMNDRLHADIDQHRFQIPTAWLWKCLKRLRVQNNPNPSMRLILAIVRDWFALPAPPRGSEDDYDDDLQFLKPSKLAEVAPARDGRGRPRAPAEPPVHRASEDARRRLYGTPPTPPAPPPGPALERLPRKPPQTKEIA